MLGSEPNLRFGVVALKHALINRQQFADACALWAAAGEGVSLADILFERGWISREGRRHVEALLARQRAITEDIHDIDDSGGPQTSPFEAPPPEEDEALTLTMHAGLGPLLGSRGISNVGSGASVGGVAFVPDPGGNIVVRERLKLRDLHSSGGIGEVWRAYDEVLDREVALKRLRVDRDHHGGSRARFFREAQITGQLEHPGIVPVYDYASNPDGTHCFYTMRFLRGRTLREVIADFHDRRKREGAAMVGGPLLQLLNHYLSVCNTMAFAHSKEVIHRDLKGDNIIVGDYGEVVVLDWGLAKRLSTGAETLSAEGVESVESVESVVGKATGTETMQGEQLGTPAYMAPEQARGDIDHIDARTDVYGLAAILYELLTGRPPFSGRNITEIMQAVVRDAPVAPRELVADVPAALERICLQGLAKDPVQRQQSVAILAEQVRAWVNDLAERKRSEQERERFFELSLDLLAIVDDRGVILQSNPAWATVLDWPEARRAGARWRDFIHAEDRPRADEALGQLSAGAERVEFEVRMPTAGDGHWRWVDWSARSLPNQQGLYLVGRDISERKRSEQEFRGLVESAPDASCVIDERGTIVVVNAALERMYGYSREELLGGPVELLVPEALRARHRGHVARFVSAPTPRTMGSGLDLQGQRKDGTIFRVEVSLSPVRTESRMLVACSLRDVDARRRQERVIKAILEAAPDAMIAVDGEQRITHANRRVEELFGYDRAELIGASLETLIPDALRERHRGHMAGFIANPHARSMGSDRVLHGRRKDGSAVRVDVSLSPVETEDGLLIACAIRGNSSG